MRAPTIFLSILALGLSVSGCAYERSRERLEGIQQNQQIIDLRLAHVEDRLAEVESVIGEIRGEKTSEKSHKAPRVVRHFSSPPKETLNPLAKTEHVPVTAPTQLGVDTAIRELGQLGGDSPASSPVVEQGFSFNSGPMHVGEAYVTLPGGRVVAPHSPSASSAPAISPPGQQSSARQVSPEHPQPISEPLPGKQHSSNSGADKVAYAAALSLYDKKQTDMAERSFSRFLEEFPQSALAPNAEYWLGECYYSIGKMDKAIMTFKDVAGKYPKHPKAAAALLKAGYAYAKLNDMENAQFYWQILLDDFPGSAPAELAHRRMAGK